VREAPIFLLHNAATFLGTGVASSRRHTYNT